MSITQTNISISGGVVFWSLSGGTDWQKLFDGCTAAGFQKECADRISFSEAAKAALVDLYQNKRVLVRPLPNSTGYAVVDETSSALKTLEYNARIVCRWPISGKPGQTTMTVTGLAVDAQEDAIIRQAIDNQMDVAPHSKVASTLVEIIKTLGGVPLKPNGGVYWIPERAMVRWADAVAAIEKAGPGNQVFTARTAMDDDAIRAVVSAIRADIGTEVQALAEQAQNGGDNKRSLASRQSKAEALLARVTDYEQLLGVTLQELKDGIEAATSFVVSAAAVQMAADMAEAFSGFPSME